MFLPYFSYHWEFNLYIVLTGSSKRVLVFRYPEMGDDYIKEEASEKEESSGILLGVGD